ncbi:hypothetical protein [Bifidobacterium jacchi]|uniref:Uncharacterized protein n=1 Tax=Bifidobacterium jacchi TaxID=2490545 RepID=A0A5N5RLC6_9BIFI|nr:hypothetical protein [Bifidobacterium jacchi]KAB5608135.1 hypothetical protein EHS19_02030 [Bifidobacterium jacchi]
MAHDTDLQTADMAKVGGARAPFSSGYATALSIVALMPFAVLAAGGAGLIGIGAWLVVLMAVFVVCSPLRDGMAGHVAAVLLGAASLVFAGTDVLANALSALGDGGVARVVASGVAASDPRMSRLIAWFAGVGGLLVVLIVVSFIRQMARAERSHLIRGLSHSVLEGVAMVLAPGWLALPEYMALPDTGANDVAMIASVVVLGALIVGLTVASRWWVAEADPDERARAPWLGIVVLPALLAGPLLAIATVVVPLV